MADMEDDEAARKAKLLAAKKKVNPWNSTVGHSRQANQRRAPSAQEVSI